MKKRILKIIAVFLVLFVSLNGCAKKERGKIKDTVIIGLDNTFVPMGFLDDKNEMSGFDVELSKEVFKRIGKKVKYENIDWATKEATLNRGSIDMIWNGYSLNEQRKKLVGYSKPYMENNIILVTMKESKLNKKDDLINKKVGTQSGSTSYDALIKNKEFKNKIANKDAVLYDTFDKALLDLEYGRIDAVLGDEVLLKYYISQKNNGKYNVLEGNLGSESYVVAFRKDDNDLKEKVDKAIDDIRKDGTLDKIYKKWFE